MRHVLIPPVLAIRPPPVDGKVHDFFGQTMGTVWSVRAVLDAQLSAATLQRAIEHELDTVVAQMSHWLPTSNLEQFNRAAADSWHELPAAFFAVLKFALQVAADSDGAYDPAAGKLINLWGFGAQRRYDEAGFTVPASERINALLNAGWRQLLLDVERRRAYQPGGLLLNLSAVAKGYAVDCVSRRLIEHGIEHHLVEVGGELRGAGVKPDGLPWWVALEQPAIDTHAATPPTECVIALHDLSVATSGDYRRYYDNDGQRHSHTIDPRNGQPIRHGLASVTVIHRDCIAADALSTALNVMGMEHGMRFAQQRNIAARFIQRTSAGLVESMTPAFAMMTQ